MLRKISLLIFNYITTKFLFQICNIRCCERDKLNYASLYIYFV